MFIHAKKIIVTGKTGERKVTGYNNVRFFKTDLSGKCDSIHSDQKVALTKLIGKPILWNFESQMTGDIMHLVGNNQTEKLDSLKILKNSFIISKFLYPYLLPTYKINGLLFEYTTLNFFSELIR